MDITVKIEGLDQLTEAIALVGSAIACTKGMVKTQEALDTIAQKQEKPQEPPVEKVEKPQEPQTTVPTGKQAYTFEQIQLALDTIAQKKEKPQEPPVEKPQEPQATVPTGKQAYTFEQIQLACAQVSQAGRREDLQGLLTDFGLNTLLDLEENQYNDFVLKLRELGGTI